ncbi:MAG TPA: hypothetical protein VGP72_33660 [Planctomycetota bacterium]|jgi:hypothetical protein
MKQNQLALDYQRLVRKRFPTAFVVSGLPAPEGATVLDVLNLPDGEKETFYEFYFDVVVPEAEAAGLRSAVLIAHDATTTAKSFPEFANLKAASSAAN